MKNTLAVRRRRRSLASIAIALVLPAVVSAADKDLAKISAALEAGNVAEAQKICAATPRRMYDFTARMPYGTSRPPQPELYADLFARCAVASLRAGDTAEASWRWHAAQAFDRAMASSSATALDAIGELPSLRRAGQGLPPVGLVAQGKGDVVQQGFQGTPPKLQPGADLPGLSLRGGFKCNVGLELVLGADGRLGEPIVDSHDSCVPVQVLVILDSLGQWRFEPARSEAGEPIEVTYYLTLNAPPRETHLDQLTQLLQRQPPPPAPARPPG